MPFNEIFAAYSTAHFVIAASLLWLLARHGSAPGALIVALVSLGLVYDNGVLSLGHLWGPGPTLEAISWPRFALHAALTPFLMLAAWQVARAAGLSWAFNQRATLVLGILVVVMAAWGIFFDLVGLELQTACIGDNLRYTSSAPPSQLCSPLDEPLPGHGPPIPSIMVVLVAIAVGIGLWRARGWPWMTLAAVAMFIAAGVPASNLGLLPGNGGEVLLQTGLAASVFRFSGNRRRG